MDVSIEYAVMENDIKKTSAPVVSGNKSIFSLIRMNLNQSIVDMQVLIYSLQT